MVVPNPSCYSFAPSGGLFEPCHLAGDAVEAGQVAGFLHFVEDLDRAPVALHYQVSGLLWAACGPGRVLRGDCVAVVMQSYE
jgi:N-alpha-acetyl-L-2,4-diaminobutyrate deacetylase